MKEPFSFRLRLFRIGEAVFLRLSSLRRKRKAHRYEITRRKPGKERKMKNNEGVTRLFGPKRSSVTLVFK
jgi:hypothetical protein